MVFVLKLFLFIFRFEYLVKEYNKVVVTLFNMGSTLSSGFFLWLGVSLVFYVNCRAAGL